MTTDSAGGTASSATPGTSAAATAAPANSALVDELLRYAALAERLVGDEAADATVPAVDLDDVRRFYAGSPDTPLLSRDGPVRSLHVPLTLDGAGDSTGFLAQPGLIAAVIEAAPTPIRSVVELGCAEGFNTAVLAKRFPEVRFTGYDLMPAHIEAATSRLADVPNARFEVADFHRLPAAAGETDLVFSVESIIHSPDMAQVLRQVVAALRPGGRMFVIELFRRFAAAATPTGGPDTDLARACALTESLLAIPAMSVLPDWIALADGIGFDHVATTDLTAAALPRMTRLSAIFARVLDRRAAPGDDELRSILTGLLICRTLQVGAHGLFAVELLRR